jgi:hypothetical protein
MKPQFVIPLTVAAVFGVAAGVLQLAGLPVKAADPVTAGVVASVAGIAGLIPILKLRRQDPVITAQAALGGTVLHLFTQSALSIAVIATRSAEHKGALPFWLLGGYWTSLIALIWQLRRIVTSSSNVTKITE